MKITGKVLRENIDLFRSYKPDPATVGVFFSPQSYYLTWAEEANANRGVSALIGYCRALVKNSIPYVVVEEEHLDSLDGLRILFLPRTIVMSTAVEEALSTFVKNGGTLICESECGAFNPLGFYAYPTDRFIARLAGTNEVGRRSLSAETISVQMEGQKLSLGVKQWLTPWKSSGQEKIYAEHSDGALISEVPVEKGKLILCGCYLGDAYMENKTSDFEKFVRICALDSNWQPKIRVQATPSEPEPFVYIKSGISNGRRLMFVFFPRGVSCLSLRFEKGFVQAQIALDLVSGNQFIVKENTESDELTLPCPDWRLAVLLFGPA